jgi:hypothetical protein
LLVFVRVWNLVCDSEGGKDAEEAREDVAEEVWA